MLREPIAGELLRLGDVGGRHLRGNLVNVLDRIMITLSTREVEPHERLDIVRRHVLALGVHDAWVPLRVGIFLLGRPAIPLHRLDVVLRDALGSIIDQAGVILSDGKALLGRPAKPPCGLGVVLRDALTKEVHGTEFVLSLGRSCSAAMRYHFAAPA